MLERERQGWPSATTHLRFLSLSKDYMRGALGTSHVDFIFCYYDDDRFQLTTLLSSSSFLLSSLLSFALLCFVLHNLLLLCFIRTHQIRLLLALTHTVEGRVFTSISSAFFFFTYIHLSIHFILQCFLLPLRYLLLPTTTTATTTTTTSRPIVITPFVSGSSFQVCLFLSS